MGMGDLLSEIVHQEHVELSHPVQDGEKGCSISEGRDRVDDVESTSLDESNVYPSAKN